MNFFFGRFGGNFLCFVLHFFPIYCVDENAFVAAGSLDEAAFIGDLELDFVAVIESLRDDLGAEVFRGVRGGKEEEKKKKKISGEH